MDNITVIHNDVNTLTQDKYWCSDVVGFTGFEENVRYHEIYGFVTQIGEAWYSPILGRVELGKEN